MIWENKIGEWWFDEFVREWLLIYYWPYFLAGNIDDWINLGITLNGIKPMCKA